MGVRKPRAGERKVDARVERTRKVLMQAFVALFFERRYDRISVHAIAARAGVGRSTFYEHYVDKEDVLAATLRVPLAGLAEAATGGGVDGVKRTLAHFRANAAQARALFLGTARRSLARVLAAMMEERLKGDARDVRAFAIAIAEAQLGAVRAWLFGEMDHTMDGLAGILHRISRATAAEIRTSR